MPDIFIISTHSIIAAGEYSVINGNAVMNRLTDEVVAHRLIFPKEVADECHKYDEGSAGTMWARAVSGHLAPEERTFEHYAWVLDMCNEVVDKTIYDEFQGNPKVAALARQLTLDLRDVAIITDDIYSTPRRLSLKHACETMGFTSMNFAEYYRSLP